MSEADTLVDFLVGHYVETGKDLSVKDIASKIGIGWPESRVRRVIAGPGGGCLRELRMTQDAIETYSKNYPMMSTGRYVKVWLYGPTRETLRLRLKASYAAGVLLGSEGRTA